MVTKSYCHLFYKYQLSSHRFGRDSFQEAAKLTNRTEWGAIDWSRFKYMVFDVPNNNGTYSERYALLGKSTAQCAYFFFKYAFIILRTKTG